jgi:hypothetical protein
MSNSLKKIRRLVIIIIIIIPLIYKLSIRKTIDAYTTYNYHQKNIFSADSISKDIINLEKKLDSLINKTSDKENQQNYRQIILNITSNYLTNHSITLYNYHSPIISESADCFVRNNCITVSGFFVDIVKYIRFLEQSNDIGQIASINYFLKYNKHSKNNELFCDIYVQNIILKN